MDLRRSRGCMGRAVILFRRQCLSVRQWLLRSGLWIWVVAGIAGIIPLIIDSEVFCRGTGPWALTLPAHWRSRAARKEESLLKRWLKVALNGLTVLIALALVAGIAYEQIGRRRDRARFPQIGRSVDIGGRTLNIFCSGAGAPPVIFESGGPGPGLEWEAFQPEAAKFTQACWYDRAGEGWSDPGPFPRISNAIAKDLHELLKRAGVPAPYVFAGASFGGLNSRVYGGLYPNEVARWYPLTPHTKTNYGAHQVLSGPHGAAIPLAPTSDGIRGRGFRWLAATNAIVYDVGQGSLANDPRRDH